MVPSGWAATASPGWTWLASTSTSPSVLAVWSRVGPIHGTICNSTSPSTHSPPMACRRHTAATSAASTTGTAHDTTANVLGTTTGWLTPTSRASAAGTSAAQTTTRPMRGSKRTRAITPSTSRGSTQMRSLGTAATSSLNAIDTVLRLVVS